MANAAIQFRIDKFPNFRPIRELVQRGPRPRCSTGLFLQPLEVRIEALIRPHELIPCVFRLLVSGGAAEQGGEVAAH